MSRKAKKAGRFSVRNDDVNAWHQYMPHSYFGTCAQMDDYFNYLGEYLRYKTYGVKGLRPDLVFLFQIISCPPCILSTVFPKFSLSSESQGTFLYISVLHRIK